MIKLIMKVFDALLFCLFVMMDVTANAQSFSQYDANRDGVIDVSDITAVADNILNGSKIPAATHEYVDLGLPSGLLWATCNVGASNPEKYGDYYAWGETEPKDNYQWSTYKWSNGTRDALTKYCNDSKYGFNGYTDITTTLDIDDDVAHVKWSGDWHMPSKNDFEELKNHCTWTSATLNGVAGYNVISNKNGNSIFLPSAGYFSEKNKGYVGERGFYWTNLLYTSETFKAYLYSLEPAHNGFDEKHRCIGLSVRPVAYESVKWSPYDTNRDGVVDVADITAIASYILNPPTPPIGPQAVDLGLPSGVKWATYNIGADKPEAYGEYYSWGETEKKDKDATAYWSNYKWCRGTYNSLTKYCTSSEWGYNGFTDGKKVLDPEDDVAQVNWGDGWRMPTGAEMEELKNNCDWYKTIENGIHGYKVASKTNSKYIFLPCAGTIGRNGLSLVGEEGFYWSSSLDQGSNGSTYANRITIYPSSVEFNSSRRFSAFTIRPVK